MTLVGKKQEGDCDIIFQDEKEAVVERRMREIHEYFGYWMDPKDPRFEVMLQQKEAQEKKVRQN